MTTLAPWTEQWQHFTAEIREQFWGDLARHTRQSWQDFLGRVSLEARDRYLGVREYERSPERTDARNGFYERDFVTRLGTCACAWPGRDSGPFYRRAWRAWSVGPRRSCC
jgi:hypothetical protein